jgi:hypothetical protein
MKRQGNVCRLDRGRGAREAALARSHLSRSLLALTGAAVVLLGCTQDPVGKAPGGLEPSPSSQQSEDRDDTGSGPGGGASGSGSQSGDAGAGGSGGGAGDGGSGVAD